MHSMLSACLVVSVCASGQVRCLHLTLVLHMHKRHGLTVSWIEQALHSLSRKCVLSNCLNQRACKASDLAAYTTQQMTAATHVVIQCGSIPRFALSNSSNSYMHSLFMAFAGKALDTAAFTLQHIAAASTLRRWLIAYAQTVMLKAMRAY